MPGFKLSRQLKIEIDGSKFRFLGEVEMTDDGGKQKFFADQVDYDTETRLMVATGNVVYTSPQTRIAAEKLEFDLDTKVGTFYNATGSSYLGDKVDKSFFGTQEPDALFYGEVIEKVGPKRYKITRGGFTSCVQPTPRWELVSSTSTVELDEYALLKNTVLKVKGVPMFYLPVMYYPIQGDDRATGFLLPTYGSSIVRGPSISNAFFWAINRSQDATIYHDWFTKRGQGLGAEYRYVAGTGLAGQLHDLLPEGEGSDVLEFVGHGDHAGGDQLRSARQRRAGAAAQPAGARQRRLLLQHRHPRRRSTRTRTTGRREPAACAATCRGNWGRQSVSATYDTTELFYSDTASSLQGGTPRLSYSLAQSRIGETPLYYSFNSEHVSIARIDTDGPREVDQSLNRFDLNPTLRVPFNKLAVPDVQLVGLLPLHALQRELRQGRRTTATCRRRCRSRAATGTCAPTSSGRSSPRCGTRPTTATRRSTSTPSSRRSPCSA